MAYSLWLRPDDKQAQRLRRHIEQLAARCGGSRFEPHVTVSSGLPERPSLSQLKQLAGRHRPPTLAALRVEHSRHHYQCLKLALRRDRALMALRCDALGALGGRTSAAPYDPHISLLYAKLSASRRRALAARVPAEALARCRGTSLQLVRTRGPERGWRVLEQVPLGTDE